MLKNISLEEAQDILLSLVTPLPAESLPLLQTQGRVSFQDLFAVHDLPPCRQAVVDGFALPASEGGCTSFLVKERLAPGEIARSSIGPGEAVGVVTGGPLPGGAGAVVPHESVILEQDRITLTEEILPGDNIRLPGEDFHSGDLLARRGTSLGSGMIGVLAAFGKNEVAVFRRPRVAVLSLGREIVPYHAKPQPGQLRDSNGPRLAALARCAGAQVTGVDAVSTESPAQIKQRLEKMLQAADIVITTGGTASGAFDQAIYILKQTAARPLFWGVRIKPGSHSGAASCNGRLVVALSGNPAACAVGYHLLVAPILRAMQGLSPYPQRFSATCRNSFAKTGGPQRFLQGYATCDHNGWSVVLLPGQKSSMMRALINCNALIDLPVGHPPVAEGAEVSLILLDSLHTGRNSDEKS